MRAVSAGNISIMWRLCELQWLHRNREGLFQPAILRVGDSLHRSWSREKVLVVDDRGALFKAHVVHKKGRAWQGLFDQRCRFARRKVSDPLAQYLSKPV
nr:hypothetical protein [Pseudomonas syringae]